MIAFIKGILTEKKPTMAVVDVGGIGYNVQIPVSTYQRLTDLDTQVKLFTHLHVRENIIQLYGFVTEQERELFLHLISVSGIGPKTAIAVLSGTSITDFHLYIRERNATAISKIPGIGKKTAERLILDLRDKLDKTTGQDSQVLGKRINADSTVIEDVILALISLGYSKQVAQGALEKAASKVGSNPGTEQLLAAALLEV